MGSRSWTWERSPQTRWSLCQRRRHTENLVHLLRAVLAKSLRPGLKYSPPVTLPARGYYDPTSDRVFDRFDLFTDAHFSNRPALRGRPWVAVVFSRSTSGDAGLIRAVAAALESQGLNALPVYSYPIDHDLDALLVDDKGATRVDAIVALSMKLGNTPEVIP